MHIFKSCDSIETFLKRISSLYI